jgi:hypothetical protein
MRAAIGALRTSLGPHRPVFVFHIDQPTNDFNTLFEVLDVDQNRYVLDDPNVFPCAIGRSFYSNVLPPTHVHLGWSSYAAQWLSRIPTVLPDHFWVPNSTAAARGRFERQGAEDWKLFLALRARELRLGGRLIVVLPALNDDGSSGTSHLMDHANAVLAEMVDEGEITAEERRRMVLASLPRRKGDLLAPFAHGGHFEGLVVEHCNIFVVADGAWADYQRSPDKEVLATKHALFFRSTFAPSLATALARSRGVEAARVFTDRLGDGLRCRLANSPAPLRPLAGVIVLAKKRLA